MSYTDIQELGLTRQRGVVLQVIREADEHLTANEVFAGSRERLQRTLFRTSKGGYRFTICSIQTVN